MSSHTLRLPIRNFSATRHPTSAQWICRRCLATQNAPSSLAPKKDASEAENYDPTLPASQRDYYLTKDDYNLKKVLPHKIPPQYLQHSTSPILHELERTQRDKVVPHKKLMGVVVRTGKMDKTVTVQIPGQTWNRRIKKYFTTSTRHLVHDPNDSLIQGDVILLHRLRVSTAVHHVVASIVSPFGKLIADRPAIPTPDERLAEYKGKRFAKFHRRELRRKAAEGDAEAVSTLQSMGLHSEEEVEAGRGKKASARRRVGKGRKPSASNVG